MQDDKGKVILREKVTILYATQTGNALDVAERIGREVIRNGFGVELSSIEFYERSKLPIEKCVIFVVSTTGQGEVPDSMKVTCLSSSFLFFTWKPFFLFFFPNVKFLFCFQIVSFFVGFLEAFKVERASSK